MWVGEKSKIANTGGIRTALIEAHPAQVVLRGGASATAAEAEVLGGEDVHAHNTFEQPNAVVTRKATATVSGKVVQCTLPPSSVTRFTITLA